MEFSKEITSLPQIFDYLNTFFRQQKADQNIVFALNLAVEEIFTNLVKYNSDSTRPIRIRLKKNGRKISVSISDFTTKPFDITRHKNTVHSLPLEERPPGGLGLRLVKKMTDEVRYNYNKKTREYTITLVKYLGDRNV